MRGFFRERSEAGVRLGPCGTKVFLPSLGSGSCARAGSGPAVSAGEQQAPAGAEASRALSRQHSARSRSRVPSVLPGQAVQWRGPRQAGQNSHSTEAFLFFVSVGARGSFGNEPAAALPAPCRGSFHSLAGSGCCPRPSSRSSCLPHAAVPLWDLLGALQHTSAFGQGDIQSVTEEPAFEGCLYKNGFVCNLKAKNEMPASQKLLEE